MKKIWKNNLFKEIFLIILAFITGTLLTLIITNQQNNYQIIKNKTKIYDKTSLAPAIEKIYNAVVYIESSDEDSIINRGTGFIYKVVNNDAYIVTNEHVITNAPTIKVIFYDNQEVKSQLLGKDEYLDLAILKVPKKYVKLLANISTSEKTNIGDTIFTVGTPIGNNYRGSVTSGILSGKDRLVSTSISSNKDEDWVMKVLQIDASINPGNSGGPLLNVNGEVIGICTMKLVDDDIEGMGFAIPIEYALNYMNILEQGKEIKRPILNLELANIDDYSKLKNSNIEIPDNIEEGVIVLKTNDDIPLKKGDIIISINNTTTQDIGYLKYELYKHNIGDTIKITYLRNNKQETIKIKLKGK